MAKQIELLTNTIIKQDKVIANLSNGMLDMQKRSMMNNVIIHNVLEKDNENCKKAADDAIGAKGIKVNYEVERAHRTGPKRKPGDTPRPLIVRMTRQDQAYNVIKAAIPAKGKSVPKGAIKITPQNPDKTRYQRAKMGQLAYHVKEKKPNVKVAVKNDHYLIDGNKLKDEVKPPTTEKILTQTISQEDECRKITFYQTAFKEEQGSKFMMYSAEVSNSDEANLAYVAVQRFKMAATSTHLISAYRTASDEHGWQDDGDHGMGRHLYNAMKDKGIINSIIFLARDFGGIHMGMRRFHLVTEMMSEMRSVIRIAQRKEQAKAEMPGSRASQQSYGTMVVEVEGHDDENGIFNDEEGSEDGSLTLEDVKSWDANKLISRPRIGGFVNAPNYFDNPKGIKNANEKYYYGQQQKNEDQEKDDSGDLNTNVEDTEEDNNNTDNKNMNSIPEEA
jgi:hypothetical protein